MIYLILLGNANPSLFFETPGNFRRKLESYIFQNNNNEVLVNSANIDDSKLRPQSAIPQRITSATAQSIHIFNFLYRI